MPKTQQQKMTKHLPTRCSRPAYKARYATYKAEARRAKNKARRIVRNSLCSYDPHKVATAVAERSPDLDVQVYVAKYLKQRNL